ncbi:hypothetical protein SPONN_1073 [uncultured Candidatus Thioglobus sp.]|nr:hypothetical protein SPONN_1073 [uncultured Candidatus Thioglobus sp.]
MEKAEINNIVGVGQAKIFNIKGQNECNGYFETDIRNANKLEPSANNIIYSGIVINQGISSHLSFPIIMSKTERKFDEGKICIEFTATCESDVTL